MLRKFASAGLVSVVTVGLLTGCMGGKQAMVVPDCTYPDSPEVAAPSWVCDAPVEGVEVSAVGSFRATKAGPAFQKTQATAAARNALAASMKVHVKQLVKNYVESTGVGDDETVDAVSSDVSKQVTNETLYGTKVFRTITNPQTRTMYVLVGMSPENSIRGAQEAMKTSYKNDKAMWQKFMSNKAHEDLDAEIEKIANQDL